MLISMVKVCDVSFVRYTPTFESNGYLYGLVSGSCSYPMSLKPDRMPKIPFENIYNTLNCELIVRDIF